MMRSLISHLARRKDRERGYVTALTALILVPLMIFAGLAVDLGGWYTRAAAIQRATDAAALAGAAALPRGQSGAQAVALAVAAQNGFSNSMPGITVTATPVPPDQMRVTITDSEIPQYFTSVVNLNDPVIRTSLAEYIPPVKMGSPRNYLGTGDLLSGARRENFWLAISSPCSSKENGDRIQALTDGNFVFNTNPRAGTATGISLGDWRGCRLSDGAEENLEYRPEGYFYAMRLEEDRPGENIAIQVYDAPYCTSNSSPGPDQRGADTDRPFTTTFRVRNNNSANPLEATVLSTLNAVGNNSNSGFCDTGGSGYKNRWRTLRTLNSPTAGIYFIQVQTSNSNANYEDRYGGSNSFAFRAVENGTFTACTTDPSDAANTRRDNCPNLFAIDHLGVTASIGGTQPSWFLADIGPEHSGKTLEVELWDAGEGALSMEVLNPLGDPVDFTWQVECAPGHTAPTGGCGPGTTSLLDLWGAQQWVPPSGGTPGHYIEYNPQPSTHRASRSKYNDRLLLLRISLPEDISAAYGGATWWRIRYTAGTSPTDRTTWSVTVRGDPVRLVE